MIHKVEKVVASKFVKMAVKASKLPNQVCLFFLGKPETKLDLTIEDYHELESFIEKGNL